MPRIRHTRDDTRHYRFNGVEFPEDTRARDVDEETAAQVIEHSDVEYVDEDEPDDSEPELEIDVEAEDVETEGDLADLEYEELQALAMEQDVAANQSRDALLEELSEAEGQ